MFNEKKIEEIRKKIQLSTLLSDHEKADWLNLLSLMNDKQLGELEEILAAEKPVVESPPAPVSPPAPAPLPPRPVPKPSMQPAPKPTPTPQPTPAPAPLTQKLPQLSHIDNVPTDVGIVRPAPVSRPAPQPAPAAAPIPTAPKSAFTLQQVEELQNLNVETLRSFEEQSISAAIKSQIEEHGYFTVLQLIEASPLYEAYISSGKAQLNGEVVSSNANPKRLSQTEFEFMTDLLSNMRFNRL